VVAVIVCEFNGCWGVKMKLYAVVGKERVQVTFCFVNKVVQLVG
jgi:hypothetical protein